MTDHSKMRLGKNARKHDSRTLQLARYMTPALPAPPPRVDWTNGVTDWGMMLNDHLGDCIIADGPGHATQMWTLNATGAMVTPPDSLILETYEKWCGYNPADPSTDQGGAEVDVLNDWRRQGFNGQTLDAYVALARTQDCLLARIQDSKFKIQEVAQAIWLFGGAYIGVELPLRAQSQDVWDVPKELGPNDEPGSWGGHAVYLVAYDFPNSGFGVQGAALGTANSESRIPNPESRVPCPESRILTCITWGQLKKLTWEWFEKYCSEAYALVTKDWLNGRGISPSGFDLAALENDLKLVTA